MDVLASLFDQDGDVEQVAFSDVALALLGPRKEILLGDDRYLPNSPDVAAAARIDYRPSLVVNSEDCDDGGGKWNTKNEHSNEQSSEHSTNSNTEECQPSMLTSSKRSGNEATLSSKVTIRHQSPPSCDNPAQQPIKSPSFNGFHLLLEEEHVPRHHPDTVKHSSKKRCRTSQSSLRSRNNSSHSAKRDTQFRNNTRRLNTTTTAIVPSTNTVITHIKSFTANGSRNPLRNDDSSEYVSNQPNARTRSQHSRSNARTRSSSSRSSNTFQHNRCNPKRQNSLSNTKPKVQRARSRQGTLVYQACTARTTDTGFSKRTLSFEDDHTQPKSRIHFSAVQSLPQHPEIHPDLSVRGVHVISPTNRKSKNRWEFLSEGPEAYNEFPKELLYTMYRRTAGTDVHKGAQLVVEPKWFLQQEPQKVVDLTGWKVNDDLLVQIAESNPRMCVIECPISTVCSITIEGLRRFAYALKRPKLIDGKEYPATQLKHANFSGCFSGENVELVEVAMSNFCSAVSSSLESLCINGMNISDQVLVAIGKQCPNLRHLEVSLCSLITDAGISSVLDGCKDCGTIVAKECEQLRGHFSTVQGTIQSSSHKIVGTAVERKVININHLSILNLSKCVRIDEKGLMYIARSSRSLTELNLCRVVSTTDRVIIAFAESTHNPLERLSIAQCSRVTDTGIFAIVARCETSMISLNVSGTGVTDLGLGAILSGLDALRDLAAERLTQVTGTKVDLSRWLRAPESIISHKEEVSALSSEEHGSLLHSQPATNDDGQTESQLEIENDSEMIDDAQDDSWGAFHTKVQQEIELDQRNAMEQMHEVEPEIECCHLNSLSLQGCTFLGQQFFVNLAQCVPELEELNLSACSHLTDSGLSMFVQHCPNLIALNISECPKLSGTGSLEAIALHASSLRTLDCSRAPLLFHPFNPDKTARNAMLNQMQDPDFTLGEFKDHDEAPLKAMTDVRGWWSNNSQWIERPKTPHRTPGVELVFQQPERSGTGNAITMILRNCAKLERLAVRHYAGFDPLLLTSLDLRVLQSLDLTGCYNLTPAKLRHLLQVCPSLVDVKLAHCPQIRYCDILESLDLLLDSDTSNSNSCEADGDDGVENKKSSNGSTTSSKEIVQPESRNGSTTSFKEIVQPESSNESTTSSKEIVQQPLAATEAEISTLRQEYLQVYNQESMQGNAFLPMYKFLASVQNQSVWWDIWDWSFGQLFTGLIDCPSDDPGIGGLPSFGVSLAFAWKTRFNQLLYLHRVKRENFAAKVIQTKYRKYRRSLPTLQYLLQLHKKVIPVASLVIQMCWRRYVAKCALELRRAQVAAVIRMQRMIRANNWRKKVRNLVTDEALRMERNAIAARSRLEWNSSNKIVLWYRNILWWRSTAGLALIQKQEDAKWELEVRRQTRDWRLRYREAIRPVPEFHFHLREFHSASLVTRRPHEQGQGMEVHVAEERIRRSADELCNTAADASHRSGFTTTNLTTRREIRSYLPLSGQGNFTLCGNCGQRRPDWWCFNCLQVLCTLCNNNVHVRSTSIVHVAHPENYVEKSFHKRTPLVRPVLTTEAKTVAPKMQPPTESTDLIVALSSVNKARGIIQKILEPVNCILSLRRLVLKQLVEVVEEKQRQHELRERAKAESLKFKLQEEAIVIQRFYRAKLSARKSDTSARLSMKGITQDLKRKQNTAATKLQSFFRMIEVNVLYRDVKGHRVINTDELLKEKREELHFVLEPYRETLIHRRIKAFTSLSESLLEEYWKLYKPFQSEHEKYFEKIAKEHDDVDKKVYTLSKQAATCTDPIKKEKLSIELNHAHALHSTSTRVIHALEAHFGLDEAHRQAMLRAHLNVTNHLLKNAGNTSRKWTNVEDMFATRRKQLEEFPADHRYHLTGNNQLSKIVTKDGRAIDSRLVEATECELKWVLEKLGKVFPVEKKLKILEEESLLEHKVQLVKRVLANEKTRQSLLKRNFRQYKHQIHYRQELVHVERSKFSLHQQQANPLQDETERMNKDFLDVLKREEALRSKISAMYTKIHSAATAISEYTTESDSALHIGVERRKLDRKNAPKHIDKTIIAVVDEPKTSLVSMFTRSEKIGYEAVVPEGVLKSNSVTPGTLEREYDAMVWTAMLPRGFFKELEDDDKDVDVREKQRLQAEQDDIRKNVTDKTKGEAAAERKAEELKRKSEIAAKKGKNKKQFTVDEYAIGILGTVGEDAAKAGIKAKDTRSLFRKALPVFQHPKESEEKSKQKTERVIASVMKRQKAATHTLNVVCGLHLTVGSVEHKEFQKLQNDNAKMGLPIYSPVPGNLGSGYMVTLWYQESNVLEDAITDILISHPNPNHPLHVQLASQAGNHILVSHPQLGEGVTESGLELWARYGFKDTSTKEAQSTLSNNRDDLAQKVEAIVNLKLSANSEEEQELMEERFKKCAVGTEELGLAASTYLWMKTSAKGNVRKKKQGNLKLLRERRDMYIQIINAKPTKSRDAQKKLKRVLEEIEEFENQPKRDLATEAKEFLALDYDELRDFVTVFHKIDSDESGSITTEEFYKFVKLKEDEFTSLLFGFLDTSGDGTLDFGEFLHSVGTLAMFGQAEVVQMCFSIADIHGSGVINLDDLENFVAILHNTTLDPTLLRKIRVVFQGLESASMAFHEFLALHQKFPTMLFPAFKLQKQVQQKIMGSKYWEQKKKLFAQVRSELKTQQAVHETKETVSLPAIA